MVAGKVSRGYSSRYLTLCWWGGMVVFFWGLLGVLNFV